MPTPKVIDLSHHNAVQSLVEARKAGVLGCIHKATEGMSFVDSKVEARRYLAREAGMLWGLYHFLVPGNMQQQAKHFVTTAKRFGDDQTLLAADHEREGVSLDDLHDFLVAVETLAGRRPVIYSGHVLKQQLQRYGKVHPILNQKNYKLWIAQYGSTALLPAGWSSYFLWQYTDKGSVPGVTPPTDCNDMDTSGVFNWSGRVDGDVEEPTLPGIPLPDNPWTAAMAYLEAMPQSRERSLAITKLQEAQMWADRYYASSV